MNGWKPRIDSYLASFVNRTGYAEICTCDYLAYRDLKKMIMEQSKTNDVWRSYLGF